jgi:hypothetical protein
MSPRALLIAVVIAAVTLGVAGAPPASAATNGRAVAACVTFPETGKTVCDRFLAYWQANGGLAQQGLPLTDPFVEVNPTDGKPYLTQYFERARFEAHPENQPPYDVLLGLLGREQLLAKYNAPPTAGMVGNPLGANCATFEQTGKRVCGVFLDYWQQHGGLAQQGLPLTDLFLETNPTDGKQYPTQYFERARFEYHAENVGTPYAVLLGLLGREQLLAKYPNGVPEPSAYGARAEATYQAMQRVFYRDNSLYTDNTAGTFPYTFAWSMSRVASGTTDLTLINARFAATYRPAVDDRMAGIARYWDTGKAPHGHDSYVAPLLGWGGDRYYDDNHWLAWELIRAYDLTGNVAYLGRAQETFAFVVTGWDNRLGGVYWKEQLATETNHDRNTVSTAGAAVVAMRLFQATGDTMYRDWAVRMVAWVDATLRDPADGLYWDHVDAAGTIERTKWSYNQGLMAIAHQLLAEHGGDQGHAARAGSIVDASLALYAGRWDSQGAAFNAIFFRASLYSSRTNSARLTAVQAAARDYADQMWQSPAHRDGVWYAPDGVAYVIETGSMLEILAMLAVPADAYARLD